MSPILRPKSSFPRIETLTIELRILILCKTADVHTFKSLILSCSAYHQAYCSARKEILLALARRVYGDDGIPLQLPYLATIKASGVDTHAPGHLQVVTAFLDNASETDEVPTTNLTTNQCTQLLSLHRDATLVSEDLYVVSLSRRLQREGGQQPENKQSMSKAERCRITKAIYRWELWSQLFMTHAISQDPSPKDKIAKIEAKDQVSLFLASYALWEQEQLGCLSDYAMRRYMALFDEVAEMSAKSREPAAVKEEPDGSFFFESINDTTRDKRRDSIVSRGPSLLARILRSDNLKQRCRIIMDNVDIYEGPNFPDLMLRNFAHEAADLSCKTTGLMTEEEPPYGWRWAREEIITDGPFPWWSHEYLAPWGYVFWDEARFQEWGFVIGGKYKYFDEDPGVDDIGGWGICERETGEVIEWDRNVWALFAEWLP